MENEWVRMKDKTLEEKIKCLKNFIRKWNVEEFGNINEKLEEEFYVIDMRVKEQGEDKIMYVRRKVIVVQL